MAESSGSVPPASPPHPPLLSGGWYHGMSPDEVLGPGRYPLHVPGDKSVRKALLLTLGFGPAGLCYVSRSGGLICSALTMLAVIMFGFPPLLIAWPLSMVCAAIMASGMHAEYQGR
ncbi:hypothetical protein [Actinophytocola sp.]|uniref:hypothetical protein n=1 Tax=Actinophytocola sp. TaxID=1872138 RepID=UPI002D7FD403|nr:hypothetical protein [Actinophytocola sp.]HET9137967.1 hypothetical protein [Actinophytocola sp.]